MAILRRLMWGLIAAPWVLLVASPASAQWHDWYGQTLDEFRLASGRTFYAQVDRRTDEQTLWLRIAWDRTVILRPVAWDRVVRATVAGRAFTGEQLRDWLLRPPPEQPAQPAVPPAQPAPAQPAPALPGPTAQTQPPSLAPAGRVAAAVVVGTLTGQPHTTVFAP